MAEEKTQNFLSRFLEGFIDTLEEDSEHFREINEKVKNEQGIEYRNLTRWDKMMAEHPTYLTLRELTGTGDKDLTEERRLRGMGLDNKDGARRAGQITGRVGQDIIRDSTRGLWWLLNAPQAVVDVAAEQLIHKSNPDLKKEQTIFDNDGNKIYFDKNDPRSVVKAFELGLSDIDGNLKKDVKLGPAEIPIDNREMPTGSYSYNRKRTKRPLVRSTVPPGLVNAMRLPSSIAINSGMGLLHYAGGMQGYEAVFPNEDDPTKTSNVLAEIGAKYIVGRTGNLLPYDEFKKVRPDVSEGEYKAYKAFKYDKGLDFDPTDGDVNLLPLGLLKATADGIHGAEVQFLGKSLPVNTALLPVATAIAGTSMGVYGGEKNRKAYKEDGKKLFGLVKPVMADPGLKEGSEPQRVQRSKRTVHRGLGGGLAGYAVGAIGGQLLENARRRRNEIENFGEK